MATTPLTIDRAWFLKAFEELKAIGRDPKGRGYQRLAWTEAERQAHVWFREKLASLGLMVWSDTAGNSFGDFTRSDLSTPLLAMGSHLDTVPFGGAFDGGLGVVGALAAAKALLDTNAPFKRRFRIAAFTDEEGPRFGTGLLGSKALAGTLAMNHVLEASDRDQVTLKEAMASHGLDILRLSEAHQHLDEYLGYLELHIEQGPRLERMSCPIATVTAITGIRQVEVVFRGETNHAGTTLKPDRKNALRAASETIARFSAWVDGIEDLVANPGAIHVHPNAANIIPGQATLQVDIRSPHEDLLDRAFGELSTLAVNAGAPAGIAVEARIFHDVPPCPLHQSWMETIEQAADRHKYAHTRLVSWAGHDAGVLGRKIPAAMIFVPSHHGISHAPEEFTEPEAMVRGATVLAETALILLTQED